MSKQHYGEGGVYLRGNTFWIRYSVEGKMRAESAKTPNVTEARKLLRKRLEMLERGDTSAPGLKKVTVEELLADVRADYTRKKQSVEWCDIVIRHLTGEGSPLRWMKATNVGTKAINAYTEYRMAKGISGATVNRELALLRRAFNLGLKHDPPKVAKALKIEKHDEGDPRGGFFSRENLDLLMTKLPPEIRGIALFAYFTGCRKSEILGLKWEWVDADFRAIRLPGARTKNGEARIIPLATEVRDMIVRLKAERDENWAGSPWVFSRAGARILDFYDSWRNAIEAAGLPAGVQYLHDMRRSAVRNMVRAGVPETVAMKISGHKTRSVFDRYNITSEDDLHDAMVKVEGHVGGPGESRTLTPVKAPTPEAGASASSATGPQKLLVNHEDAA